MGFKDTVNKGRRLAENKISAAADSGFESHPLATEPAVKLPGKLPELSKPILIPALQSALSNERDGSYIHASELTDYCPRRAVIASVFGVSLPKKDEPPFSLSMVFEIGHSVHNHLQNVLLARSELFVGRWQCQSCLKVHGGPMPEVWIPRPERCDECGSCRILFMESTAVDPELGIGGSIDGGLQYPDGIKVGVEIKTISPTGFESLTKARGLETRCAPEHVPQAQIYMHLFGLPRQHFLYVSKGWHGLSGETYENATGHVCGPIFETYVDRSQSAINEITGLRRSELTAMGKHHMGVETYPPMKPFKGACTSKLTATAKSCPVRDLCFELKEDGK